MRKYPVKGVTFRLQEISKASPLTQPYFSKSNKKHRKKYKKKLFRLFSIKKRVDKKRVLTYFWQNEEYGI